MKGFTALLCACAFSLSLPLQAKIADYDVVLLHGFNFDQLSTNPDANTAYNDAVDYWKDRFWGQKAEEYLAYNSASRLEGNGGIAHAVVNQLATLASNKNLCIKDNPCIIVTHSTGDLVLRYILANLESLLDGQVPDSVINSIDVAAVLDFAGAGGGTELATLAVAGVATAGFLDTLGLDFIITEALEEVLGFDVTKTASLGVINDLQPSVARSHATNGFPPIPRLRFVGTGGYGTFGSLLNLWILKGDGDSVVPLHSSCGAASSSVYNSCVNYQLPSGVQTSVNAPSALWDYHYPILMGATIDHSEAVDKSKGHALSYIVGVPDDLIEGLGTDFNVDNYSETVRTEINSSNWWKFWTWWDEKTYEYATVAQTNDRSMSQVVFDTLTGGSMTYLACVYENQNWEGKEYCFNDSVEIASVKDGIDSWWNDRISSVRVKPGYSITLHQHNNYGGIGWSYDTDNSLVAWNDSASSISVSPKDPIIACVYKDFNYREKQLCFDSETQINNLNDSEWGMNDKISSIKVFNKNYQVALYEHSGFSGDIKIKTGFDADMTNYNDKASSLRVELK